MSLFKFVEITQESVELSIPSSVPSPSLTGTGDRLRIQCLHAAEVVGEAGSELGQFRSPLGICIHPQGAVYVADSGNSRVQRISPDGEVMGLRPSEHRGAPDASVFRLPTAVALDGVGHLFVLVRSDEAIWKFGPDGLLHDRFLLEHCWSFAAPEAMAIDQFHNLFVVDSGANRIVVISPLGKFVEVFGQSRKLSLSSPRGLALVEGGAYIADTGNHRIVRCDSMGRAEYTVGAEGSRIGELREPVAVAVDPEDNLYVLESGNQRIQMFPRDYQPRVLFDPGSHPDVRLRDPHALALAPDGSLWVSDSGNHRLLRFTFA